MWVSKKRIEALEGAVRYQTKLLETIVDQLDTRGRHSDQMRKQVEQQTEAMLSRLKSMPGVAGNPQYQQAITDLFKNIGVKE